MKYYNLLILFMITLKCKAAEESAILKYSTIEEYLNTEAFSECTTEGKPVNVNNSTETYVSQNTSINDSGDNVVGEKETLGGLPISRRFVQQGTQIVKDIGSFIKGMVQQKEADSKDYEVVDDRSQNIVINATSNVTEGSEKKSITNKEFDELSINKKPRQRTRKVVRIIGSLMEGLVRLNEPDSKEDEGENNEELTSVNDVAVNNVTNSDVFNSIITKAPVNIVNKWTQFPNSNSSSEVPAVENTLIKATGVNTISSFTNKKFGKLPIPTKPRQKTRTVTSIIGSLMEGLARLNEPASEEDEGANDEGQVTVTIPNSEVLNAITTEAPENIVDKWTHLPNVNSSSETPIIENTLIKATSVNTVSPFIDKEINKLPIMNRTRQRNRKMVNIIGSLTEGLAQLNEPDSDEDEGVDNADTRTVNGSKVECVTNNEASSASTIEAPINLVSMWTETNNSSVANTIHLSESNESRENTLIHVKSDNARSPFKKEIGKLPISIRLQQQGRHLMENTIGSFLKGLIPGTDSNKDED